jgi:ABC-type phosphate/phosphonate transport system substrate-binding protein
MSYYSNLNGCFLNIKKLMLHKTAIVTFMFLAVLLSWFSGQVIVGEEDITFPVIIETSTTCQTTATANKSQLIVFTPSKYVAQLLTKNLCDDKVVAKQYGSVIGYWGYRTVDSLEFVGKGIADLILAKNNIMDAFKAESTYNYQPVVGFSDYTAFFISSKEKPKISKQYFLDKKIGLLDYPTSRSGHILPKQAFKELGLNIAQLKITYASSHNELRELLANGEVDLIASFWRESDSQRFSKNYITPISSNVAGTRWYLKMQHNNTDLLCAVQSHLLSMSKEQSFQYYQDVEPYWQCNSYPVTFIGES